jgi:single-stranded-DNA-specific exonuclease
MYWRNPKPLWVYPKPNGEWVQEIAKEFSLSPVTAEVLAARGFTSLDDIHDFLYAKLPDLHDPELFLDMSKAVDRILKAIDNKEAILIYGDNDVDGITGTTLLVEFILSINGKALPYIPHRTNVEQNLLQEGIEFAEKNGCTLLITVDCGLSGAKEIATAVEKNIDVIVTDHHEPTARLPHCIATLNPKLINSTYPNRELTGVGVAFKLAHAITNTLTLSGKITPDGIDLKKYLDLVAMGTIADMGTLKEENRILVRYGLKQLRETKRIGLAKLCSICELKLADVTTLDIASKLAPRLNSLGRIADPNKGVELLLLRDPSRAEDLAKELDLNNIERQKIERKDFEDIEKMIASDPHLSSQKAIVLSSSQWHPGIIPIITTRISKQFNRPTLIVAIEKGIGKGSIRTIPEFPLLPVLKENSDLLLNFGGHDFAAGLTLDVENLDTLKHRFIVKANDLLKDQDILPKLHLDAPIKFSDLTFDFMESLSLLEPFGNENPLPIFYCDVSQTWPPRVIGKTHLKLYLEQNKRSLEGIAFNMANYKSGIAKKRDLTIAFTPQINTFMGKSSIQLLIRALKPAKCSA